MKLPKTIGGLYTSIPTKLRWDLTHTQDTFSREESCDSATCDSVCACVCTPLTLVPLVTYQACMPAPSPSIMPGFGGRENGDTGHKAPYARCQRARFAPYLTTPNIHISEYIDYRTVAMQQQLMT